MQDIANKSLTTFTPQVEKEIREAARKYLIFYNNLTPIVYTNVKDSGVQLSLRYLCPARKRRGTGQTIWEDILPTFLQQYY